MGVSIEEIVEETVANHPIPSEANEAEVERLTVLYKAALADEPVDNDEFPPYFDLILDVFASRGVELVSHDEVVQDIGQP
jgi:hypothetical protein